MEHIHDIEIEEKPNLLTIANDNLIILFDKLSGLFSIMDKNNNIKFKDGFIIFKTKSDEISTKSLPVADIDINSSEDKIELAVIYQLENFEIKVVIKTYEHMPYVLLSAELKNKSSKPIVIQNIAFNYKIESEEKLWYFKNGFGSWDLTTPEEIKESHESYWYSALISKNGKGLTFGFTAFKDFIYKFNFSQNNQLTTSAEIITDYILLNKNDSLKTAEIYYHYGNVAQSLHTYAKLVNKMNKIKLLNKIPTGWSSWYYFYTFVSFEDVIRNAELSRKYFGDLFEYIQVDDGYQIAVGDWYPNDRFSQGLDTLVKEINRLGYKAGIWLAPFIAIENSELFKKHQDWFIKDENNKPKKMDYNPLWNSNIYALDLTHPEVVKWLSELFKRLKSYGFDYFKIDFLYHAMSEGDRYNNKIPRGTAFQKALEIIRDAVGNSLILGCGAPLGTSLGYVDAMRIGEDVAPTWLLDWGGGIYHPALNTIYRNHLNGTWWLNDPDCVLIRQDDSDLSDDEIIFWLTVVSISGGLILDSDNLPEVNNERIELLRKILPPKKTYAIPVITQNKHPEIFYYKSGSARNITIVSLLNFDDKAKEISIKFDQINVTNKVHVSSFWDMSYLGIFNDNISVKLSPHSAKILVLKQVTDRPDVILSNGHFAQEDTLNVCWNEYSKILDFHDTQSSNFIIAIPKSFRLYIKHESIREINTHYIIKINKHDLDKKILKFIEE